ncbi:MAG: UDP-N-acetylmuramate dehydrogenase [Spirochaetaceae bacterium]|nr:UDP-N-acetylmuramate dehydrogenase [Spirochaetaceae bacterium]
MYNVRKIAENINTQGKFQGQILQDEPLAQRTTFKVGGNAALFFEPQDIASLQLCLKTIKASETPFIVLGGGSNVVVPDEGLHYVVISSTALSNITHKKAETKTHLVCSSGCTIQQVTEYCNKHKLGGLENFSGLPGTVGGATYMNARCYEKSISDVIESVKYIQGQEATEKNYIYNHNDWDYKKSPFQNSLSGSIITEVTFNVIPLLTEEAVEESIKKASSFLEDRRQKGHFKYPSAGSVFKNNRIFGQPSGKIIDQAGLRGIKIGGAQIAPWHGNFIINIGNATAKDIKSLVEKIIHQVQKSHGFTLEPEIIFLTSTL